MKSKRKSTESYGFNKFNRIPFDLMLEKNEISLKNNNKCKNEKWDIQIHLRGGTQAASEKQKYL